MGLFEFILSLFEHNFTELIVELPGFLWNQLAWRDPGSWVKYSLALFATSAWFPALLSIAFAVFNRRLRVRFAGGFARFAAAFVACELAAMGIIWLLGYWVPILAIGLIVALFLFLRS